MRLPQPFVRLPLRVDAEALAGEVAAIDSSAWRAHPEAAPGNTALALVAVNGDPTDDATRGRMLPTPHLEHLPYTVRVLAALDSVIGRTRLMRIEEEGELLPHVDSNYYWWEHVRIHVPVVTSPDVVFECGGERVNMAPGEVWAFDTWRPHSVSNPSSTARTHLVADTVGSASLWALIDFPDRPPRMIETGGDAELVTEAVNHPVVMTPWEIDRTLDALLGEAGTSAPEPQLTTLAYALRAWRHAWRTQWAANGDAPSGWPGFVALRRDGEAILDRHAGGLTLPNSLALADAIRQLVLRPALGPEVTAATKPASVVTMSRQVSVSTPEIDRPIFVVSPPRSGSTMLFEALARAPYLFTVGGESHRVIEEIPALHPRAHDWESNRLTAVDATPEVVAGLRRSFLAQLRDRRGSRPGPGPARLLEKTPKNALRVPFLAAAFPDAVFVSLYRDPRETVSSMLDAWRSGSFVTYPALPGWSGPPWSLLLTPGWRDLVGRSLAEIVAAQWTTTVTSLLDDLEALPADRWCVASYDRLVAEPGAELTRICDFADIEWDVELTGPLPLSRHTVDSPHPEKWRRNAEALEPVWDLVRPVGVRAHEVFGAPPRKKPVRPTRSPDASAPSAAIEPDDPAPLPRSGDPARQDRPAAVDPDAVARGAESFRSVHAGPFAALLAEAGCSVVVSTYQSGRLIIIRTDGRTDGPALNTHFRSLRQPMGMAVHGNMLAIGTLGEVRFFSNQPAVTRQLSPPGVHDACFLPKRVYTTGDLMIHDLAFAGHELWIVNTRFSCLATLDDDHSFVPRWRPPFVSALAPEDRCHLNGLAVVDGRPRYVTALGLTDEPDGWRANKRDGGVLLDVDTGQAIVTGLCMPHSPRWNRDRLWMLESGTGGLSVVDLERGVLEEVVRLPGFTRGLSFIGPYALVGLSQVRETVFEGLPLTDEAAERRCGIWVVDTRSGEIVAFLRFEGIVQELFEVTVLPGVRFPELVEPGSELVDSSFVLPDDALGDVPATMRAEELG